METLAAVSEVSILVVWSSLPRLHCDVNHLSSGLSLGRVCRAQWRWTISMAQKYWGVSADDCHLEMGRDGLREEGVFQMGSVAFQESIGRFLMKEEQSGS